MVSTRKRSQSKKMLLSHLDDFDIGIFIRNAASNRQEKVVGNEGIVDLEITVNNTGSNSTADENLVNVK